MNIIDYLLYNGWLNSLSWIHVDSFQIQVDFFCIHTEYSCTTFVWLVSLTAEILMIHIKLLFGKVGQRDHLSYFDISLTLEWT